MRVLIQITLLCSMIISAGERSRAAANSPGPAASAGPAGDADDPTKQTDKDWMDDRWQQTEIGRFLGGTIATPGRNTFKGLAIRLGEGDAGAVCFDTDLMRYSAGWTSGFLKFHPRRYGLIVAPALEGEAQFITEPGPGWASGGSFHDPRPSQLGPLPRDWAKYKGLYLHGQRVVLSYTVGETALLESPWIESPGLLNVFSRTLEVEPGGELRVRLASLPGSKGEIKPGGNAQLAFLTQGGQLLAAAGCGKIRLETDENAHLIGILPAREKSALYQIFLWSGVRKDLDQFRNWTAGAPAAQPLKPLTLGGPPHWTVPLSTQGHLGRESGPFAIDTLTIPYDNPWNALMFVSGHDFFDNGDIALSTIHGDVWVVSGVNETLSELRWTRFATGLYQPLGLRIVGNLVHVLERDQITILHDLNGNGQADFYQNFNNDCISAGGGHSYATCLETDGDGNFYFLKCAEPTPHGGTLLRVSADGNELEVMATGFRNPNGLGISPDGLITVADQQGEWIPETRLDLVRPGGFYGYVPMHHRPTPPESYDPPLLWIPRAVDNSAGGQAWAPPGQWGPLAGKMIHLSYGRCTFMAVLMDEENGRAQGAVAPLPGRFLSGVMRARFNPHDGHLYLSGMRGWQTAAVRDGSLQRVRYTGEPLNIPVEFSVHENGVRLTFSTRLDREMAEDLDNYSVEQWNYRWSAAYGSPDYSVAIPDQEGRDQVEVRSVRLLSDGRSVFLKMDHVVPVMQMGIQYNLDSEGGEIFSGTIHLTVNAPGPRLP